MFAERAAELVRNSIPNPHALQPYDDDGVRTVLHEMENLFKANMTDANATADNRELWSSVQVRHNALERNKRCILTFLNQRIAKIRTMRWEFGAVLPPDVKELLSEDEFQWFTKYSLILAKYMRSLGGDVGYFGIDLTENLKPPKSLYTEVLCLTDYGKLELEDGDVVFLKKNSRHYLPTSECQTLIRQGVLKQLIS